MTDNLWKGVAVVALVLAAVAIYMAIPKSTSFGAVGLKLIEQYDPYVKYNGGVNSALPIKTSNDLTASSTTLTASKFCIQFYATSSATVLKMVASTTATLPHGAAAVMTANYGTCA